MIVIIAKKDLAFDEIRRIRAEDGEQ